MAQRWFFTSIAASFIAAGDRHRPICRPKLRLRQRAEALRPMETSLRRYLAVLALYKLPSAAASAAHGSSASGVQSIL